MHSSLQITPISGIPQIKPGDDIAAIILEALHKNQVELKTGDVVCIASKIVSIAEDRFIRLDSVIVSEKAHLLHQKIPRKDPRVLQVILDETKNADEDIRIDGSWIGAKNHIGRILTSAGVDKVDDDTVLLLPNDPYQSAQKIGEAIKVASDIDIGIIITDSDGREGIAGATQLCIGLYGVPPVRANNGAEETVCDMLAAAAGLVMGQRGTGIPAVVISGYSYVFGQKTQLKDAY